MDHIWHYGGAEYYFDISEKICLSRITRALREMKDTADSPDCSAGDAAGEAERHCGAILAFFSTVLGEDASREICGTGAEECSAAYVDFILFVRDEVESLAKIRSVLEGKLSEISS